MMTWLWRQLAGKSPALQLLILSAVFFALGMATLFMLQMVFLAAGT